MRDHDYPEPPERPRRRPDRLRREPEQLGVVSHPRHLTKCPASGKARHADYYAATRHVRRLIRTRGGCAGALSVYRCPDCHDYHVGHGRVAGVDLSVLLFWEQLERPEGYW